MSKKAESEKFESTIKVKYHRTPHICPVCGGNGLVPNGFYSQTSGNWSSINATPEKCKSCTGTGIVWG